MRILIIPSWYPSKHDPSAGIFFVEQAKALSKHPALQIQLLNWGQNAYQLALRHPLQSLVKLIEYLRAKRIMKPVSNDFDELCVPHLTWTSLIRKGNVDALAKKVVLKQRPDIIHAHVAFPAGYLAYLLSQKLGVPFLITEHSGPFPFAEYRSDNGLSSLVGEPLQKATKVIAVSSLLKNEIMNWTGINATVIPNLVDTDKYQPNGSERVDKPFTLFALSGLSVSKGALDLVQALKLVHDRGLDFQLYWGGDGKLRNRVCKLLDEYGLHDKVHLLGHLSQAETIANYQNCDCFILPSRIESFSMVLIEAMSCGVPAIASKCGGPRDIVQKSTGLLVPKQNPVAMAEAITTMSHQYQEYSPAAIRNSCIERFGAKSVSTQIIEVYASIMNTSKKIDTKKKLEE